jgi:hypothetical protein
LVVAQRRVAGREAQASLLKFAEGCSASTRAVADQRVWLDLFVGVDPVGHHGRYESASCRAESRFYGGCRGEVFVRHHVLAFAAAASEKKYAESCAGS